MGRPVDVDFVGYEIQIVYNLRPSGYRKKAESLLSKLVFKHRGSLLLSFEFSSDTHQIR